MNKDAKFYVDMAVRGGDEIGFLQSRMAIRTDLTVYVLAGGSFDVLQILKINRNKDNII